MPPEPTAGSIAAPMPGPGAKPTPRVERGVRAQPEIERGERRRRRRRARPRRGRRRTRKHPRGPESTVGDPVHGPFCRARRRVTAASGSRDPSRHEADRTPPVRSRGGRRADPRGPEPGAAERRGGSRAAPSASSPAPAPARRRRSPAASRGRSRAAPSRPSGSSRSRSPTRRPASFARGSRALGVEGVRASTFHSAALTLLRHFRGDPGRILATKALLLRRIGNGLPKPYRFRPAGDLATEIEWAKNRRLTPETYLAGLGRSTSRRCRPTSRTASSASTSGARPTRARSTSRICSG